MEEKIQFNLYLPKSLVDNFRVFVAQQYGKVERGYLSFEAAQAIQAWMSTHKSTQTQLLYRSPNPIPNVFIVKEQVKEYLKTQFGYEQIYKVPKRHIVLAISALRGTDKRTVKKWMKLFEKWKVIKWVNPNVIEFLA